MTSTLMLQLIKLLKIKGQHPTACGPQGTGPSLGWRQQPFWGFAQEKARLKMTCVTLGVSAAGSSGNAPIVRRFQCTLWRKVFIEPREEQLDGMYLPIEKAERVLHRSLEGNSASNMLSASRKFITVRLRPWP